MNLLEHLSSGNWAHLLRALEHTLWEGGAIALLVLLLLRRSTNPVVRYRLCFLGLCGIFVAGLATWALPEARTSPDVQPAASISVAQPGRFLYRAAHL